MVTNATTTQSTTTVIDPCWSLPATVSDLNAKTTTLEYDLLGRLVCVFEPLASDPVTGPGTCDGTGFPASMSFGYGLNDTTVSNNDLPSTPYYTVTRTKQATSPAGRIDTWAYTDPWGQARETQSANPGASGHMLSAETWYDDTGTAVASSAPRDVAFALGHGFNNLTDTAGTNLEVTRTAHDEFARTTTVSISANGTIVNGGDGIAETTTTAYTAAGATVTPPGGGPTLTYTGARGMASAVYTYQTSGGGHLTTTYAYSYAVNGNRTSTRTDPIGTAAATENTSSTTDWLGRVVSTTSADAGTTTSTYDPAGNLSTATSPTGAVSYHYDVLERPTSIDQTAPTSVPGIVSWAYDSVTGGNVGLGRLTSDTATDFAGHTYARAYTYDARGRTTVVKVTPDASTGYGTSYTTSYTFNEADQQLTETFPFPGGANGAETITTGYDTTTGVPMTVTGAKNYVTATGFQAANGLLGSRSYNPGNATNPWVRTYTYTSGDQRLASLLLQQGTSTPAQNEALAWSRPETCSPTRTPPTPPPAATGTPTDTTGSPGPTPRPAPPPRVGPAPPAPATSR